LIRVMEVENLILKTLEAVGSIEDSREWSLKNSIKHDDSLVGTIKRLESQEIIETRLIEKKGNQLTEEAESILQLGSPEARTFRFVSSNTNCTKNLIESQLGEVGRIGFSQAMKNQWISFDKATGKVSPKVQSISDITQEQLNQVKESSLFDENLISQLRKRKLINSVTIKTFCIKPGPKFGKERKKLETDLTTEMLASSSWEAKEFKDYNFNALGTPISAGSLHPLLKVRSQFRSIFLEMGFEEMPTNNYIESSFWNFDSLFQPQQHPARDAHDTFFLSDPAEALFLPEDYKDRVKAMHEKGGFGSIGWRYEWKLEESKKNILRTHTTAVSSRMLYKLAQEGFRPKKYFSIDRVFRNEAMDATHLAEFHQVEGLVADYHLSLGNLIGMLSQFFERLGIRKLRFKPAYNPYTEPSMEVFSYHEGLKKWVEVGNSGIFRPEMLRPMGFSEEVSVIAWGLSLERPTMIKYGISNIRDLVGHKVSLEFIKNNPICRLNE